MRDLIRTSDMDVAMQEMEASYPVLRELANFVAGGNRLPSPPAPCIRIAETTVEEDVVIIRFNGSSPFTCQLDGGIVESCMSPVTYTDLSTGPHMVNITGDGGCAEITEFNITCK